MSRYPAKLYEWEGEKQTAKAILKRLYLLKLVRGLTLASFNYRLKVTGGDVRKSYNFKANYVGKKHTIIKCPDGFLRTNKQIAGRFRMSASGWANRVGKHGFEKAYAMGRNKAKPTWKRDWSKEARK